MNLETWLEFYRQILKDFNFSKEEDEYSAVLMHKLGKDKLLDSKVLVKKIRGKDVIIIGPILEDKDLKKLKEFEGLKITAGKALLSYGKIPGIHVTDMEEPDELLVEIQEKGCLLVLHAHGDNIERVKSVIPKVKNFIGTTQSIPFDRIYNFGGFTDGDRAVCMAKEMGARRIELIGFDFGKASGIKKKKLEWARKILAHELGW